MVISPSNATAANLFRHNQPRLSGAAAAKKVAFIHLTILNQSQKDQFVRRVK